MTDPAINSPTSVYRYYDRYGLLIYVGITARGIVRNREHNERAPWWPFVTRQEVDHYDTRAEAEMREKGLIVEFRPPFNVQHNCEHQMARAAYLAWARPAADVTDDPREVFNRLGGALPVVPIKWDVEDAAYVVRTQPDDFPVVTRINFTPGDRIFMSGQAARVKDFTITGAIGLVFLKAKRLADPERITMRVKWISQKPVAFRIASLEMVAVRKPNGGGSH